MALQDHEVKSLAIEMAAAMPPAGEPANASQNDPEQYEAGSKGRTSEEALMGTNLKPDEALARLCNAECMLDLAIAAHDELVVECDEWKVNEALHGVKRLLEGCYSSLVEAVGDTSPTR